MLSINNIDVSYSEVKVIRKVSFEVREGEIVALVGANGAGKSTILKTISGLLRLRLGTIEFFGQSIHQLQPSKIVSLGLVQIPEGRKIFPSLTVRENLEMGSYLKSAKQQRKNNVDRVFNIFPILKEKEKQPAGTLSGGQQQMLAIGRGLMSVPKLLMIDEPSLGLSPVLTEQISNVIKEINTAGTTILLVEQNVFASLSMSHRGYVLENGQIVLQDDAKKLIENQDIRKAYLGL